MPGFISASIPTEVVRVSNTTLFHLAAKYLGDPTLFNVLADLNGISDPWITELTEIIIPPASGLVSNGGIMGQ